MSSIKGSLLVLLVLLGITDAAYLTREHYYQIIPPCELNSIISDCGKVLSSSYSVILGVPLALLGLFHYTILLGLLISYLLIKRPLLAYLLMIQSFIGFIFSLYLVYLQLWVIGAICFYCMGSALISTLVFILIQNSLPTLRKVLNGYISQRFYINLVKPLLFKIDPERVHVYMVLFGEVMAKTSFYRVMMRYLFKYNDKILSQKIAGISFDNPIGLAAGFDYEARLTQSLEPLGFGFQTVGTITFNPYEGNPKPMLGRLPKSRSLMVNKGFKNLGAMATSDKLSPQNFPIPLGVSIGKTNTLSLKTLDQAIEDLVKAFQVFERSKVKNSYYELNISCPNLMGKISFYPPQSLRRLLLAVDKLRLKKPIFVKMPIDKTDQETLKMLEVIAKSNVRGVIFGNLQKNRQDKVLDPQEVAQFKVGNFSGKPTEKDSNHLLGLAYKKYKDRFIFIGCGGVFTAQDAYQKIIRGASLIQLITGIIYNGPQQAAVINYELSEILKKQGFKNIQEAVGTKRSMIN